MQSDVEIKTMSHSELVLFARPDCHLCDVAAQLLAANGLSWHKQNIETDIELIRRYGIRIPVLYRPDIQAELGWPFDQQGLVAFLELQE